MASSNQMIDPAIFEDLRARVDQDSEVRDKLRDIIQTLEKQGKVTAAILSRAHSTPTAEISSVTTAAETAIAAEIATIAKLSMVASKQPYYKWNNMWSRQIQDTIFSIIFTGWLGGYAQTSGGAKEGKLIPIEEVGQIVGVPINTKTTDTFHLTIEEYLQSLITLLDELARLARNSVTLGNFSRPLAISLFIKDVHAGFQVLNLRNDALRRRSDGLKYRVKEVEDVVYDLTLRGLVGRDSS